MLSPLSLLVMNVIVKSIPVPFRALTHQKGCEGRVLGELILILMLIPVAGVRVKVGAEVGAKAGVGVVQEMYWAEKRQRQPPQ